MTTENANFQVKVGEFEGPLDLLLGLIEKRKMHISDVSLAQVADDYISYLKELWKPEWARRLTLFWLLPP